MSDRSDVAARPVSGAGNERPVIIVKTGNPAIPFVLALLIGAGAFFGGMLYEREKHADYSVRVSGVPSKVEMTGAPDAVRVSGNVSGIPQEILVKGAMLEGIPKEITFKGTALDGILPKEIEVRTAAIAPTNDGAFIVVTPQGGLYLVGKGLSGWDATPLPWPR